MRVSVRQLAIKTQYIKNEQLQIKVRHSHRALVYAEQQAIKHHNMTSVKHSNQRAHLYKKQVHVLPMIHTNKRLPLNNMLQTEYRFMQMFNEYRPSHIINNR